MDPRDGAAREQARCYQNISLGGHAGDHDGTSDIAAAIDHALNETPTGFAIVVAVGNERDDKIHALKNLGPSGDLGAGIRCPGQQTRMATS